MNNQWDNIDNIYFSPAFSIKKGTTIKNRITLDGNVKDFDLTNFGMLIRDWTYAIGDSDIKPFKIIGFETQGNTLEIELKYLRKDKDVDELRLFCQDILDVLNYFNIFVTNWKTMIAD